MLHLLPLESGHNYYYHTSMPKPQFGFFIFIWTINGVTIKNFDTLPMEMLQIQGSIRNHFKLVYTPRQRLGGLCSQGDMDNRGPKENWSD